MNIYELEASLKLDTSEFTSELNDAQSAIENLDLSGVDTSSAQSGFDSFNTDNFTSEIYEAETTANGMDLSGANSAMETLGGTADTTGTGISGMMSTSAAAIGEVVSGISDAFGMISEAVDTLGQAIEFYSSGQSTMVRATGATGIQLELLSETATAVWKCFVDGDQSLEDIQGTAGEVNTKFGYYGDTLKDTTLLMAMFTEVTGQDGVSAVDQISTIMNKFNLTSEDTNVEVANMEALMQDLTTASQGSGASVAELESALSNSSMALNQAGIDTETAIAWYGSMEHAVDGSASALSSGLSYAVKNYADDLGEDLGPAIQQAISQIQNSDDAFSAMNATIEGTDLTVSQLFGSRYAKDITEAMTSSAFNVDEMTASLQNNSYHLQLNSTAIYEHGDTWDTTVKGVVNAFDAYSESIDANSSKWMSYGAQVAKETAEQQTNVEAYSENATGDLSVVVDKVNETSLAYQTATSEMANSMSTTSSTMSADGTTVENAADGMQSAQSSAEAKMRMSMSNMRLHSKATGEAFETMESTAETSTSGLSASMERAKDSVQQMATTAQHSMQFSWDFPYLALPHISSYGSFNYKTGSAPQYSVSWYAKAMDEAMVLDSATIFGASGGNLLGGGEAGREVVAGESHLLDMINSSVTSAINPVLSSIANILSEYLPKLANNELYIDGDTLVGYIDKGLNKRNTAMKRGGKVHA